MSNININKLQFKLPIGAVVKTGVFDTASLVDRKCAKTQWLEIDTICIYLEEGDTEPSVKYGADKYEPLSIDDIDEVRESQFKDLYVKPHEIPLPKYAIGDVIEIKEKGYDKVAAINIDITRVQDEKSIRPKYEITYFLDNREGFVHESEIIKALDKKSTKPTLVPPAVSECGAV